MKDSLKLETFCYNQFTYLNESIRFADAKAGILITINGVVLGYIFSGNKTIKINEFSISTLFIYLSIILLIISYHYTFKVLKPSLIEPSKKGLIFWEDVISNKESSYLKKVMETRDFTQSLIRQNHTLSKIASTKFNNFKNALAFSIYAYIFLLIGIILSNFKIV